MAGVALGAGLSPSCRRALDSGVDLSAPPVGESLSKAQLDVVAVLAELVIPQTDTPGAIAARVPDFINQIVVDWYTQAERQIFLDGLAELDHIARQRWSAGFMDLQPERQAQVLTELEPPMEDLSRTQPVAASAMSPGASGEEPFFVKLKELTVLGYYTSEIGAKAELTYRPVPGAYDGDAVFGITSRQWIY